MQYETFIDRIVNSADKRLKPFSPDFDASFLDIVRKKALKGEPAEEKFDAFYNNFVTVSKKMNIVYNDVYTAQQKIIEDIRTPAFDIISHLVAFVNYNCCIIVQKFRQLLTEKNGTVQSYCMLFAAKLESNDKGVGLLPIDTSLEMQIDVLSMLINYIRYFREKEYDGGSSLGSEYIEAIKHLFINMNKLCALKSDYDDSILNEGFFRYDEEDMTITFDYLDHDNLKLLRTGVTVLNQKVMHEYHKNLKPDLFAKCFSDKRIEKMEVSDGKVILKYSCGMNKYLDEKAKSFAASIISYYGYLKNVGLPNFANATIIEAISIWIILQALADYIQENFKWNFCIRAKADMGKIPCRIMKNTLCEYVVTMSNLSTDKIKKVLNVFVSSPDDFCDMWNEPLYDCGSYYTIPLFAISYSMNFNIIDFIIEKGGINLQDRGLHFEKYIVETIEKTSLFGYKRNVFGSRKYERNKGDYQEIDCVVELKDIVIVAELKCIRYPMSCLNHHDCWNRLKHGCEQAAVKVKYIQDNPKLFQKISASIVGKKIIPVVVTNYPNYTGFSHAGVHVIDAHAFTSYLNSGVVTMNLFSKEEGNIIVDSSYLYKNEVELSSNFIDYLQENPLVKNIKKNVEIREMVHPTINDVKTRIVYASAEDKGGPVIHG